MALWRGMNRWNKEPRMPKKKKDAIPRLVVPKNATLKQIYAIAKKEFTAADLQKYTEIEPLVPMEQVLADMERIHLEETRKLAKPPRRKKRK
jgi:hypothetical protein